MKAAIDLIADPLTPYEKIIIVRPAVEAEEKLGSLPGNVEEKLDPMTVTSARGQLSSGKSSPSQATTWLMHFAGIDDRNLAERLCKNDVYGEPIEDSSVMWVHELIGAEVEDVAGVNHGRCVAVVDNPAHALLELESGALVPIVFVVSRTKERITIDPPQGLFDLNEGDE